jgi:hypothetical protein
MRAYFVRHPLVARPPRSPGRVAYDVRGYSLRRDRTTYEVRPYCGTIFADGFRPNEPGPNLDPNVFADVIPWFHAFCQISSSGSRHHVRPSKATLSEVASPRDIILFGNAISKHMLFVDAVLCVDALVPLPQLGRTFQIEEGLSTLLSALKLALSGAEFRETRAYGLSLRDAEPDGCHPGSALQPHRMIVGRRRSSDAPMETIDSLQTRFLSDDGFNFIPLLRAPPSKSKAIRERPGLFVARFADAQALCRRKVSELDEEQSRRLLHSILSASDELILDPIQPQYALQRAG